MCSILSLNAPSDKPGTIHVEKTTYGNVVCIYRCQDGGVLAYEGNTWVCTTQSPLMPFLCMLNSGATRTRL
jgi:hypothetical protein